MNRHHFIARAYRGAGAYFVLCEIPIDLRITKGTT